MSRKPETLSAGPDSVPEPSGSRTSSSRLSTSTSTTASRSRTSSGRKTTITSATVFSLLLLYLLSLCSPVNSGLALNEYISHFEPAHFSLESLAESHRISKRSTTSGSDKSFGSDKHSRYHLPVKFNFTAHNRLFLISLQKSAQDIFSDDIIFENTQGPISFNTEKIYSGFLEDSPSSSVHGIVTSDGYFDGHISTPSDEYYIEPAHRYFPDGSQSFHSVIYKTSDVLHPSDQHDDTKCKSHEIHLKHKECSGKSFTSTKNKTNWTSNEAVNSKVKRDVTSANTMMKDQEFEAVPPEVMMAGAGDSVPHLARQTVTTYEVLDWEDVPESVRHHFRKRAKTANAIDVKKRTCMLYLQADHLFYENMGSEEACIEAMTRHVQRVNSIYNPIDFDGDGIADNISFMIKRIKVHTSDALKDPGYRFPGNYGVEKFLELFSEENYDAFCLAYMFTYRDFEGGTLGLAWTGDLKNAGGVCERNGHYRGSLKSLNTGIITFLNYGKHVPPAVSHVTMAHEMGHNFGSPHDPENNKACVPGGDDGNYIMFARATSGDKKNNRNFSPCSLKSIKPVLLAKARGPKGCFKEPQTALCGNGVVEDGEECDCGWAEDCTEDCCWPQRTEFPANEKPCTLRPNKVCSPTQGPCCTNDCEFRHSDKCRDDNGCRGESFCDGTGPQCPNSDLKPNKTVCHEEFVCYKGECTGSICLAYGMESCQCSQGPDDPLTKSCELCCKEPGDDKPCMSSFQLNEPPWDVPDMFSKPGTPCNNYKGYCDVFQKCRQVDPSGPLATLRKLLLSEKSIASLKKFLTQYWYTVIFIIVGVLILMALIVRFCGKKTPLVHRKRRHRRSVHHETGEADDQVAAHAEESSGDGNHAEAVQVHPAVVELSLPFGKKVRLGEKKKPSGSGSHHRTSRPGDDVIGASSRVLEGVARATRLAGNLGQRIANMPNGSSTSSETNPITANEESPKKEKRSSRGHRSSGVGIINTKRRPFKSLSPDKRLLAKGLAESVSRSFEKLDLVSPRRIVNKRKKTTTTTGEGDPRSSSADADNRRRKRKERSSKDPAKTGAAPVSSGKELTIAKLGKFTFSLEVNNGATKKVPEAVDPEKEERRRRRERRKKSREEQHRRRAKKEEETEAAEEQTTPETKVEAEKAKVRRPSLVVVSKRQKSDRPLRESPEKQTRTTEEEEDDFVATDYRLTFGRRQKSESFSRSISHPGPPPNMAEIIVAGLDSNNGIKRNNSFAGDKLRPEKSSSRLKRSETEKSSGLEWSKRLGGGASGNSAALLLSPKPAFENRAYDKSPEPKSGKAESLSQQKSESLNYLREKIKSSLKPDLDQSGSRKTHQRSRPSLLKMKSSSLDAPAKPVNPKLDGFYVDSDSDSSSSSLSDSKRRTPPTQIQSLSEESANGDQRNFDEDDISSTTSSDSEMEIVVLGQKSSVSNVGAVSRSKIIERVVKKESIPETQSRALLLASSLSSSSISMSPSEDEATNASKHKRRQIEADSTSNVEFIFPGEESSKSPSLQQTSLSVSSLSERYSRKDSASSTTSSLASPALQPSASAPRRKTSETSKSQTSKRRSSKSEKSTDLDNISILTDGMG